MLATLRRSEKSRALIVAFFEERARRGAGEPSSLMSRLNRGDACGQESQKSIRIFRGFGKHRFRRLAAHPSFSFCGGCVRDTHALLLCGHGSRDAGAVEEFGVLALTLRTRALGTRALGTRALGTRALETRALETRASETSFSYEDFGYGFLEFARPTLGEALDALRAQGVRRIDAVPGMLLAAGHAKNDIPALLRAYARAHGVTIHYGRPLGLDARMLSASSRRVTEALEGMGAEAQEARHGTLLLVVGRGSSDPDANGDVAKLMRVLWESLGFGWGLVAYSGVTFPLVAPALERAAKLGFGRIVVFPYFLFRGILIDRIYRAVDEAASMFRDISFVKARYLDCQEDVVATFMARAEEIETGDGAMMNCGLCKYREQIVGFEAERGAAQESHHHHVEGIGVGQESQKDKDAGGSAHRSSHAHTHLHSHAPYPQADHPLGAKTLGGG